MTTERRIPSELTLAEAALFLGVHRSNAHRKFKPHLKWATHNKRRVRVVPTTVVIQAIAAERNEAPAIPAIERLSERIAGILAVQERQGFWAAKVARKVGVPL